MEAEEGVEVEVEVGESWAAKERPIRGPRLFLIPRLSYLAQRHWGKKSKVGTVPYLSGHHFQVPIQNSSMRNSEADGMQMSTKGAHWTSDMKQTHGSLSSHPRSDMRK